MSAAGGGRAAGEDRFEGLLPTVLFAAAAVASGVLLVVLGHGSASRSITGTCYCTAEASVPT